MILFEMKCLSISKCLPRLLGKRRIMQTGPWRQVQVVIHCFTALIHLHAVHAVLCQHFFFYR